MKGNKAGENPDIMTIQEVAEYLACHPVTVRGLVADGELPAIRLGSSWRFRREDVDRWIEKRETAAAEIGPGPPRRRKKE